MRLVERTIEVNPPAEVLYGLLTDPERFVLWMAPNAEIDARIGGTIRWTHANGDRCAGRFVELVPARRVVFTYGWERPDIEVPLGSTTVEITLAPLVQGTELRLVHHGLTGPMDDAHGGGWTNYLARLAVVAEGGDPGLDPLANERVPSAAQLAGP